MLSMAFRNLAKFLAFVIMIAILPVSAQAAPGATNDQTDGAATARVVGMFEIAPIAALRFGAIAQPSAAGKVTINSDGTITTSLTFSAVSGPRGPAVFVVRGEPNRRFLTLLPGPITISNGTSTMTVDQFRSNTIPPGTAKLSPTGLYILNVGGRLNVSANQEAGSYTGTFDIMVLYQ